MRRICPECEREWDHDVVECPDDGARTYLVQRPEELLGQKIDGRFTVRELIGSGGMGSVYRARQHSMDRDVALKVLRPDWMDDERAVRRFFRESRVASRLTNPHTITVFDFGQSQQGLFYIAMELLKGRPLTEMMGPAAGPMDPTRAVRLVDQVLASLEEAHAAGVVHRDLKPDNIFVLDQPAGFVKVLDFGIAKMVDPGVEAQITLAGQTSGTPEYMSPEQAHGKPQDARSDLYSLGLILFELLAGRLPFSGSSTLELLVEKTSRPAPRLREVNPDVTVPGVLEEALSAMLHIDPTRRPADAATVRQVLARAVQAVAQPAPGDVPSPRAPGAAHAARKETEPSGPKRIPVPRVPPAEPPPTPRVPATAEVAAISRMVIAALDLAEEGHRLYGNAISRCRSEPARKVFSVLLSDQASYVETWRRARQSLEGRPGGMPDLPPSRPRSRDVGAMFEDMLADHSPATRADALLPDMLDLAIGFERKVVEFWEKQRSMETDSSGQMLARRMHVEAKDHVATLVEVKLRVLGLARGGEGEALYVLLARQVPVVPIPRGTAIFSQGEPGDTMVVVAKGSFLLEIEAPGGRRVALAELGPGAILGEMTCLDPAPRSATVTAMTAAEVCQVDRDTVRDLRDTRPATFVAIMRVVLAQLIARIRETDRRIDQVFRHVRSMTGERPSLDQLGRPRAPAGIEFGVAGQAARPSKTSSLQRSELAQIERIAWRRNYQDGVFVCSEGEPGASCFVVTRGVVEIAKSSDGGELALATLAEGSIVGQVALLMDVPRSASVRARGEVEVLELDRRAFQRMIDAHAPVALRFLEELSVTGIRQLRIADQWLARLLSSSKEIEEAAGAARARQAKPPREPVAPAVPKPDARPAGEDELMRRLSAYMRTALKEWGMSLDDLDKVRVVVPDGLVRADEARVRRARVD